MVKAIMISVLFFCFFSVANLHSDFLTINATANEFDKEFNNPQEYTSIANAVQQFEVKYKKKIVLPTTFPFIFTKQKGRMIVEHQQLEIVYINEKTNDIVKIFASPQTKQVIPYQRDQIIVLKNGISAYYRLRPAFHMLDFQKDGVLYRLWVGTNTKKTITSDTLSEIANSMTK